MKPCLLIMLSCYCSFAMAEKSFTTQISMQDGIKLSADIYIPLESDQASTILIRTPYKKEGAKVFADYFQSCGFTVVVQDVRGKYASEGRFTPFLNEYKDGIATLNWIEKQSWFNGSIGMWGSSYLGYCSLILAQSEHESLKSIFTLSAWIDGQLINSPGGAFHQMLVIPWLLSEGRKTQKSIKGMDLDEIFRHLPLKEVVPSFERNEGSESLDQSDFSNREYQYEKVKIPILQMGGWYDFATNASLASYEKLSNANGSLLLGPWYHNQIYTGSHKLGNYDLPKQGYLSVEGMLEIACDWFQQTLVERKSPQTEVRYYVLFENEWKVSSKWPPNKTKRKEFYLCDSLLIDSPNLVAVDSSSYQYDPMDPNPTIGGANFHFFLNNIGIKEQINLHKRNDELVFTSPAYQHSVSYAGEVVVEIYVKSEGIGTDFTAKLCKQDSLGKLWNLVDGIKRVDSERPMKKTRRIKISLGNIAFQIQRGESLVLQISSSNFPKYNRNPNNGIHPMDATELRAVKQTIYYGQLQPSKLILNQLEYE